MAEIKLNIRDLVLDNDNPRIPHAEGQQQALQRIVKDQKTKLVKLAQSIVSKGLNPMDRLLVLEVNRNPKRYISLEGNRRVAALRILTNPAVMTDLEMPSSMKKIFEKLAKQFDASNVEPIACFELDSREEAAYWLRLRHKGENQGMGIVDWSSVAQARFDKRDPALQALEMVTEKAGLSQDEVDKIQNGFPLSTLKRLLDSPEVRKRIGVKVKANKLVSELPTAELVKPLKKMVLDLATKRKKVGDLMKTEQMVDYVDSFDKNSAPDFSKKVSERPIDGIPSGEFGKVSKRTKPRTFDPSDRKQMVPKGCPINVTDNRIAEIYKELRTLTMVDFPNSCAVLMRVFLELSVDHFLTQNSIALDFVHPNGGKRVNKTLDKKLVEVVALLVQQGTPQKDLNSVTRALSVQNSPLNIDLLHSYVHNRFSSPSPTELKTAWNNAQILFEKIWP